MSVSLLSMIKRHIRHRKHQRQSDAASRQMELTAQREIDARLTAMEIRLRNELHKR